MSMDPMQLTADDCLPVTLGTDLPVICRSLYFASSATISIITANGFTRSNIKVVAGEFPVKVRQVVSTTGGASDVVALI